jgi:hypothetical protein
MGQKWDINETNGTKLDPIEVIYTLGAKGDSKNVAM